MEKILIFIILTIFVLLVVAAIYIINDYGSKHKEAIDSLAITTDSALDALRYKNDGYTLENAEEFKEDLIDNILLQMKNKESILVKLSPANNNDEDMIVVDVFMNFKWFIINKVLTERRVILFPRYAKEEIVDYHTATFMAGKDVYMRIDVPEEDILVRPAPPEVHGYNFLGWCIEEDPERLVLTEEEWETMYLAENTTFDAVYFTV